jgi:hypothetical protein
MFRHLIVLNIALIFLCTSGQSFAQNTTEHEVSTVSVGIAGLYRCEGQSYKGTVSITKTGDTYLLKWKLGTKTHVGVVIRHEDMLASSWSMGRDISGIVVYKIEQGPLPG